MFNFGFAKIIFLPVLDAWEITFQDNSRAYIKASVGHANRLCTDLRSRVMGTLHYRQGQYFPQSIDVSDIQLLPSDNELPALSTLRGIAPNATDGMTSEDFVRKLRDAWQE
jgi:hypothetical protein